MSRTLPTERLTGVVAEALTLQLAHQALRRTVSQVLKDWGAMPQEAIISSLREALDQSSEIPSLEILQAVAYLRTNSGRLNSSRNRQRTLRGLEPRHYDPDLPSEAKPSLTPTFSLEDIEAKLSQLSESKP